MKISEFAEKNNVTTKMLRHYDEIGLLKPWKIDNESGYRIYNEEQSQFLYWISVLKNLDFSLTEIKELLSGPVDSQIFLEKLKQKRINFHESQDLMMYKKRQLDNLIKLLEKVGFNMNEKLNLAEITFSDINEIKKNMPNVEMLLEKALDLVALNGNDKDYAALRIDIWHFKRVNDDFGHDVGDKVIVAYYNIFKDCCERYAKNVALSREHGDEFMAFYIDEGGMTEKITKDILSELKAYDFSTIGCPAEMGCYLGCCIGKINSNEGLRKLIENSVFILEDAAKKGKNTIQIQKFASTTDFIKS